MKLRFLAVGDVFGRNGRRILKKHLPELKEKYSPDFCIVNTENITSGSGMSISHLQEMEALGFDVFTGGNHTFKRFEDAKAYMTLPTCRQIRPLNFWDSRFYEVPGKGYTIVEKNGARVAVINLLSPVFMGLSLSNPFLAIDELLLSWQDEHFDAIVLDFHRETTSESYIMSSFLDGRVSFVYGTHTHVQTNDAHILPKGTGMICDVGMCGGYSGSIGHTIDSHLPRSLSGLPVFSGKPEQDLGPAVLNAVYFEVEDMKCTYTEAISIREPIIAKS